MQKERVEYWEQVRDIDPADLVFIDESGINLGMIRSHARSEIGQRAIGKQPRRGQNISLLGAMGLKRILSWHSLLGAYDGLSFEGFVLSKLVPNLWPGACVVMDNCSIHKGEQVREFIESVGARLIYLPPYSPDFSPIENGWSKLKNELKKIGARTYRDLMEAIQLAFDKITEDDIRNWFTHCCYRVSSI